ncbi:MAG TPA: hypothetical protein PKA28_17950 [Methylomusa anaerophila]|nr:hypothetical protein [Methylomusa anaerophila]HML90326.1 hypothetical protein [Methylomusa anaerophila]
MNNTELLKKEVSTYKCHQNREVPAVVSSPRTGCDCWVLETFMRMEPQHSVCLFPAITRFLRQGFGGIVLRRFCYLGIQAVAMFPHTYHVESVAVIEAKSP